MGDFFEFLNKNSGTLNVVFTAVVTVATAVHVGVQRNPSAGQASPLLDCPKPREAAEGRRPPRQRQAIQADVFTEDDRAREGAELDSWMAEHRPEADA
jgi:hypothetical protein